MARFYGLELRVYVYGPYQESFGIGFFRTRGEAEATAQRYMREVPGFRDYECESVLIEIDLPVPDTHPSVYTYEGWNLDPDGEALDIVSGFFASAEEAEAAMEAAKSATPRQEWALSHWKIGECDWAEGFERTYADGTYAATLPELRAALEGCLDTKSECAAVFAYHAEPVSGTPLGMGDKLFLMEYKNGEREHTRTIRQIRDIVKIDTAYSALDLLLEHLHESEESLSDLVLAEELDALIDSCANEPLREASGSAEPAAEDFLHISEEFRDYDCRDFAGDIPELLMEKPEESLPAASDLCSWRAAFEFLRQRSIRITVHRDYAGLSSCCGYIEAVEDDFALLLPLEQLLLLSGDDEQEQGLKPIIIDYKSVTAIDFA